MLIFALLALTLAGSVGAQEAGKGIIDGQLVNKTPGGAAVSGVEVTLKTFTQEKEAGSQTTKTDAQGRFRFEGLDITKDITNTYQVVVPDYQGAEYDGDYLTFAPDKTTIPLEMAVYDPTTDGSTIKVVATHVVMYVQEGNLLVEEFYQFSNSADKTYVGTKVVDDQGRKETLRFGLPTGASQIEIGAGLLEQRVVGTAGGFVDTVGVAPGNKEVSFVYIIPFSGGKYDFSKAVEYPTDSLNFFVQRQSGIQISSSQLTDLGTVQAQNMEFARYSGKNLAPGTVINASLSGLAAVSSQDDLRWVALIGAAVVLAGLLGLWWRRRRGTPQMEVSTVGTPQPGALSTPAEWQQTLLVQLATLDDSYEAGVVSEVEYRRRRAELKAELVTLMESSGKSGVT